MGYVFRPLPGDLLAADAPQLAPLESDDQKEHRLVGVLLGTMQAVPAFRNRVMLAAGLRGNPLARAEIHQDVHLSGRGMPDENGVALDSVPDGLVRLKGPAGQVSMLLEAKRQGFGTSDQRQVRQLAKHLAQAKRHRIQRVLTVSNTVPSAEFLQELSEHPVGGGLERLRSITWLGTIDYAFHLLERRQVTRPSEVYLLEQYIRFIKEEAVRDQRARTSRSEGAIFFKSLGADWETLGRDLNTERGLDARDPRYMTVALNWLAFVRFLSLMSIRGGRTEDIVVFPNVRAGDPLARARMAARKLRDGHRLSATFRRRREFIPVTASVDFKSASIQFQVDIRNVKDKDETQSQTRALAMLVQPGNPRGNNYLQIFWPGEKEPRRVALSRVLADPVATAPPQHGLSPDRYIIERTVPFDSLLGNSESFVQLFTGEFRAFRVSVRHLLRRGLPG